jgi:hypothetical protein
MPYGRLLILKWLEHHMGSTLTVLKRSFIEPVQTDGPTDRDTKAEKGVLNRCSLPLCPAPKQPKNKKNCHPHENNLSKMSPLSPLSNMDLSFCLDKSTQVIFVLSYQYTKTTVLYWQMAYCIFS